MDQKQTQSRIEVFCLGFKDGKDEGYILCLDRDRLNADILKIPERYPGAIVSKDKPYPVKACQDTYRRICQNGGRLVVLKQEIPKCGESC